MLHFFTSLHCAVVISMIISGESAYCCLGNDYANLTAASLAGYSESECVNWECGDCACLMVWEPVCCDGVEFSNNGCAGCYGYSNCGPSANITNTNGTCIVEAEQPYCCAGNDFANLMAAMSAGYHRDECVDWICGNCRCNRLPFDVEWAVCCDGRQFNSEECAECYGYFGCDEGECPLDGPDDDIIRNVSANHNQADCICAEIYDPYCCYEVTYDNQCHAECYGFDVMDECESSECVSSQSMAQDPSNKRISMFMMIMFVYNVWVGFCE